jgi:ribosomal-protein-alanine N-acetyltransferase
MMAVINQKHVIFRPMVLADVPTIAAIEQEVFTIPWTVQALNQDLMQNHFAHYFVMQYEEDIIGYGGMWLIVDEAHVTNIAVRPQYQGQGLGELLLDEIQRQARRNGAERMTLEVRKSNVVAQRLYVKKGFEHAGIRPGYYSDNNEDALIMWAELL